MNTEYVYIIDENSAEKKKNGSALCYRDEKILNRYHFEYPPEWRTSSVRERVIGFRSLFISKEYRHLEFDLDIKQIITDPESEECIENEFTVKIDSWLNDDEDFRKIWRDIRKCINKHVSKNKIDFDIDDLQMDYEHKNNCFNNILYTRNNNLTIKISNLNDDAKNVLNTFEVSDEFVKLIRFENVWDRKPVCLKSNISINNSIDYLAYSNKSYNPIKYYRIESNEPSFHIDFYLGNKLDEPINLPRDNKEKIVLGIIIHEEK